MKQKISISVEKKLLDRIKTMLKTGRLVGRFRNTSHVMEYAVMKLMEDLKQ